MGKETFKSFKEWREFVDENKNKQESADNQPQPDIKSEPKSRHLGAAAFKKEETKRKKDFSVEKKGGKLKKEQQKEIEEIKKQSAERRLKDKNIKETAEIIAKKIEGQAAPKPRYFESKIDEQIAAMEIKLRNAKNPSEMFNKKATSEQKQARQKEIAVLERGIKDAQQKKAEIKAAKAAKKQIKGNTEESLRENYNVSWSTPIEYEKTDKEIEEQLLLEAGIIGEADGVELNQETEKKLEAEAKEIKEEIEKMPLAEKKSFLTNVVNSGFTVQKLLNRGMAKLFEKFGGDKDKKEEVQEEKGIAGDIKRFFWAAGEKARQNADYAEKQQKMPASSLREAQSIGYLMKYGRSVADAIGWTAGSPLKWAMIKMQGIAFLSGALKESRFLEKDATRLKDINDAAEEAYKIKEMVENEAKKSGQKASRQLFEKIYNENLPQILLERLKRTEPGTAAGILSGLFKKVIENDIKISLKLGRFNKAALENRLKDFDKLIGSWGAVDALAFIGKYAETGSKAAIAGIQVETAYLLMQKIPEIMSNLHFWDAKKIDHSEIIPARMEMPPAPEAVAITQAEIQKVFEELGTKEISVQKGDNLWDIVGKKLDELNWGDDYGKFAKGQKIYAIDFIKDKLAALPPEKLKEIGIKSGDVNKLNIGDKIDLSEIMTEENVSNAVERAQDLTSEQISGIENSGNLSRELMEKAESDIEKIQKYGYLPTEPLAEEIEQYKNVYPGKSSEEITEIIRQEEGIKKIFEGKGPIAVDMPKVAQEIQMFGKDILGEGTKIISDRRDGVKVIQNAFGQKGFDLLFTDEKIGVDGPAGWNWGSKGKIFGFGNRMPTEELNSKTIEAAKNYIMGSVKKLQESADSP